MAHAIPSGNPNRGHVTPNEPVKTHPPLTAPNESQTELIN